MKGRGGGTRINGHLQPEDMRLSQKLKHLKTRLNRDLRESVFYHEGIFEVVTVERALLGSQSQAL